MAWSLTWRTFLGDQDNCCAICRDHFREVAAKANWERLRKVSRAIADMLRSVKRRGQVWNFTWSILRPMLDLRGLYISDYVQEPCSLYYALITGPYVPAPVKARILSEFIAEIASLMEDRSDTIDPAETLETFGDVYEAVVSELQRLGIDGDVVELDF